MLRQSPILFIPLLPSMGSPIKYSEHVLRALCGGQYDPRVSLKRPRSGDNDDEDVYNYKIKILDLLTQHPCHAQTTLTELEDRIHGVSIDKHKRKDKDATYFHSTYTERSTFNLHPSTRPNPQNQMLR